MTARALASMQHRPAWSPAPPVARPIAVQQFDSTRFPPPAAFAAWAGWSTHRRVHPAEGAAAFHAQVKTWRIGRTAIEVGRLSPMRLARGPHEIAADGQDDYTLLLIRGGRCCVEIGAEMRLIESGRIVILDASLPWTMHCAAHDYIAVRLPRATIAAARAVPPRLHGRVLESGGGRMLADHFVSVANCLPSLAADDVATIESATHSLILNVLAAPAARPQPAPKRPCEQVDLAPRIRLLIDRHLTDPDLSIDLICRTLGVSRARLYRVFDAAGGIAAYIQSRRLEAARALIADSATPLSLGDVADMFCFTSQAHFSTAFRRCFGFTPREARRAAA